MELTNLIWHLGAALAAIWAGLAYRSLNHRFVELEQGLLTSLVLDDSALAEADGATRDNRRRQVARARAVRWIASELKRTHGLQLEIRDKKTLFELPHSDWCRAISRLHDFVSGRDARVTTLQGPVGVQWTGEGRDGRWVLVALKGG